MGSAALGVGVCTALTVAMFLQCIRMLGDVVFQIMPGSGSAQGLLQYAFAMVVWMLHASCRYTWACAAAAHGVCLWWVTYLSHCHTFVGHLLRCGQWRRSVVFTFVGHPYCCFKPTSYETETSWVLPRDVCVSRWDQCGSMCVTALSCSCLYIPSCDLVGMACGACGGRLMQHYGCHSRASGA